MTENRYDFYLRTVILVYLIALICLFSSYSSNAVRGTKAICRGSFSYEEIPPFSGAPFVRLNNNEPYFNDGETENVSFELYGPKDEYGRCTPALACIGTDLMSSGPRGDIGSVIPTGWRSVRYDCVPGGYLYNRCHLIGYQLAGENDNENNIITGTRFMNNSGMLPFENMIADYVKETDNHVYYRVTPVFLFDEAVARGVVLEARSVEDNGAGICFCVYVYNCQPGIVIDYLTGDSAEVG